MKPLLTLALILSLSTPAWADTFAARLAQAQQAASATPAGTAYDQGLNRYLPPAVHQCITPQNMSAHLGSFTLVADVDNQGRINNIDVAPPTQAAWCFANALANQTLPIPPQNTNPHGWPIFATITLE